MPAHGSISGRELTGTAADDQWPNWRGRCGGIGADTKKLGTRSALRVALAAILLPLVALIGLQAYQAYWRAPQLTLDRAWVDHSFEVIFAAQAVWVAVQRAQSGERGYLLTADPRHLAEYERGIAGIAPRLDRLRVLTADNPDQQRRVAELGTLIEQQSARMKDALDANARGGLSAAIPLVRHDADVDAIGAIHDRLGDLIGAERELLNLRVGKVAADERHMAYMALAGGGLALALAVLGVALAVSAFRHARALESGQRDLERRMWEQERHTHAVNAHTQKMEALGQLTGGVAHDFNNVLHVIRNAVAVLERRLNLGEAELKKYLEMIRRNADRAAMTTARLLAFSREQALDPEPLDLNNLIAGLDNLLRHVLGASIRVETALAGELWAVCADRNQLETALINLAVNARDAMPDGGTLTIATSNEVLDQAEPREPGAKPGQYALIAVSDTGVGMAREVVAKAFDPFFTTKEVGRGTGLGLSQVFGFVKQSEGHVKIVSEPGRGATVRLYLPRLADARAAASPAVATPAASAAN
jgi:signal transduction histidine kinase